MIRLYSDQRSGNCYKVRLLLTQVGVPFDVVEVDVLRGEQRTSEFRAKNPNGKVPTVRLEDRSYLSESGAILYHFAQGTPLWPDDSLDRARVLQWLFFEQYSHEPYIAVARFWCHYLKAEERYREALVEKRRRGYDALAVMEGHLGENDHLAAGRYTIADISLYAYTHVADEGGFDLDRFPAIRQWMRRVEGQPGYITIDHVC